MVGKNSKKCYPKELKNPCPGCILTYLNEFCLFFKN